MSNGNEPARPLSNEQIDYMERGGEYFGFKKRDQIALHFGAAALGGLMANTRAEARTSPKECAEIAFAFADAFLKESEK